MIFRALIMFCQLVATECQIREDSNSPYSTIEECQASITIAAKRLSDNPPNLILTCLKLPSELKIIEYPDIIRQMINNRLDNLDENKPIEKQPEYQNKS